MRTSEQMFNYIQRLQDQADSSFELYPEYQAILPNDAIAIAREANLRQFCEFVESLAEKSGHPCSRVLKAFEEIADNVKARYLYIGEAIDVLIRDRAKFD